MEKAALITSSQKQTTTSVLTKSPRPNGRRERVRIINTPARAANPNISRNPGIVIYVRAMEITLSLFLHHPSPYRSPDTLSLLPTRPAGSGAAGRYQHVRERWRLNGEWSPVPCRPWCLLAYPRSRPDIFHRMQMCLHSKSAR